MSRRAWLRPRPGPALRDDERGSFVVLEAVLVAMLVLTAIIFFTSVQRPSTGADQGGLDLAQVSADTLQVLRTRTINGMGFEAWVTNATRGNTTTLTALEQFLDQVLPTGTRYSLRLNNGLDTLQLAPSGQSEQPRGGRVAEITLLPRWTAYRNQTSGLFTDDVAPGQIIDPSNSTYYKLVSSIAVPANGFQCFQAPNGYTTGPDGLAWAQRWRATAPATPEEGEPKAVQGQVPLNLPLGRWKMTNTTASVGGVPQCTGTASYVDVVRPECLPQPAPANCASPFVPYGLQLVVWFGA